MKTKEAKSSLTVNVTYGQNAGFTGKLLHAALRYLILLTAVIGMGVSVTSILGIKVGFLSLLLSSVYTFTTFYFLFKSLRGMIFGIAFGSVGMLIVLRTLNLSLKTFFVGGFNGIFNSVLDIIKKRGYKTIPYLDKSIVTDWGILVIITVFAAVPLGLSCRKRTRMIPYAVCVALPAMIFMLAGGDVHLRYFAPAVAAACAMAAMELAEKGVKGVIPSSFVGFTSLVLSGVLMLTPIVNTKTAMDPIGFGGIGGFVQALTPDIVRSNVSRSVNMGRRIVSGKKILTVYTNDASTLYLRNWTGSTYGSEKWYAPAYDYGYSYADFARENDYFLLTKSFIEKAKILGYGKDEIGIGMTDVSIVMAANQKNLPLPSMSGRTGAIYNGGSTVYPIHTYDGISTLEMLWKGKIITNAAVVSGDENELLSDVIHGYFEYLVGYCAHDRRPSSAIGRRFATSFYKYENAEQIPLTSKLTSFAKSAYGQLVDDKAIDRAVEELFENTDIEKYFDKSRGGSGTIISSNSVEYGGYYYELSHYGMTHALDVAKLVSDYLADGRRYDTNPKTTGKSVTEELLYGSKEGYCVQFATVGTLIMRRLGFYARYAEGYVVQNYKVSSDRNYAYESKVTDKEGHAWCEVWIDSFGWMTVEMTPGFGESNGGGTTNPPVTTPPETSDAPIVTTPPVTDTTPPDTSEKPPVTTPPETTEPISDTTEPKTGGVGKRFDASPFIIAAVILIPTVALISAVVSTVNKKKKRLDALIVRALSGSHNSEERRLLALSLKTALSSALSAYRALPKAGELPESYGLRLEETLSLSGLEIPLSVCVQALVKQIYGFGMDDNDIKVSALTLRALRVNALRRVGIIKLIIYKIKGVL